MGQLPMEFIKSICNELSMSAFHFIAFSVSRLMLQFLLFFSRLNIKNCIDLILFLWDLCVEQIFWCGSNCLGMHHLSCLVADIYFYPNIKGVKGSLLTCWITLLILVSLIIL